MMPPDPGEVLGRWVEDVRLVIRRVRKATGDTGGVTPDHQRCDFAPAQERFVTRLTGWLTLGLEGYEK